MTSLSFLFLSLGYCIPASHRVAPLLLLLMLLHPRNVLSRHCVIVILVYRLLLFSGLAFLRRGIGMASRFALYDYHRLELNETQ